MLVQKAKLLFPECVLLVQIKFVCSGVRRYSPGQHLAAQAGGLMVHTGIVQDYLPPLRRKLMPRGEEDTIPLCLHH